jgi:hypothetical protein
VAAGFGDDLVGFGSGGLVDGGEDLGGGGHARR